MSFKEFIPKKFARFTDASNFQQAFRPIQVMFIVLGGILFTQSGHGSVNYKVAFITTAWFLMINFFCGKFMLEWISDKYASNDVFKVYDFTVFILRLNMSVCIIVTLIGNIIYAFTYQSKLALRIGKFEYLMRNAGITVDWSRVKSYSVKKILSLCIFQIYNILLNSLSERDLNFIFSHLSNYFAMTVIIYNSYIYMTTVSFEELNTKLATLKHESVRQNTNAHSLVAQIALAHLALCKLVREHNAAFGLQLLMVVLNSFGFIIYGGFLIFSGVKEVAILDMTLHFNTVIVFCIFTVLLVETCRENSKEAFKSLPISIDVMNEEQMNDEELADTLLHFMQQISKPEHTAFGFFKLDRTLYFNILMSSSTFIVMLLQTNNVAKAYNRARLIQNQSTV